MKLLRTLIGAITLGALIFGAFYFDRLLNADRETSGLRLTLLFDDASGLRVGSSIRTRGVPVGEVLSILLSSDGQEVEVYCSLETSAHNTLRAISRFWIVRPLFRSLSEGASGLDTLIKDSYIAYDTPNSNTPKIESGARFHALPEQPQAGMGLALGESPEVGDLQLSVVFLKNSSLSAGSPVRYRGISVGVVERVQLAADFSGVWVHARIKRNFRASVFDRSKFWIARPEVDASWLGGVDVHNLEALLQGAYLTYWTPEDVTRAPAPDSFQFRGLSEQPNISWPKANMKAGPPAPHNNSNPAPTQHPVPALDSALARVYYSFIERDTFTPDDNYSFENVGIALLTRDNVPAILVSRTAIEGHWLIDDGVGDPEISRESLQVKLSDGTVQSAGRAWIAENNEDLALLRLKKVGPRFQASPVDFKSIAELGNQAELIHLDSQGLIQRSRATLERDGRLTGTDLKSALVVFNERVVGILSSRGGHAKLVSFALVPESLRPQP